MRELIEKVNKKRIWHERPVYCFTSDIDWASEAVLNKFFELIDTYNLKPTLFLTHKSKVIEQNYALGKFDRGIHPNFLPGSSHGDTFEEIVGSVSKLAPKSILTRSHRGFEVTDTSHLLHSLGYRCSSNCITIMQPRIYPVLHESGLINVPVFFEDGTHLYNKLNFDFEKYEEQFHSPGIKVISIHPMNFVMNPNTLRYMRRIKDSLTREEFNNITPAEIRKYANGAVGIKNTILDIIKFVKDYDLPIMSLTEIYNEVCS